uniref:GRF-type domain-containing protein n=1 Tax=Oryza rufipogon TaxID=4529 RepID=A0A0E0NY78_ORYRU
MASSRSEGSSVSSRHTSASPILYRVGPLEYEPAVACRCGNKAVRWISRISDNPGRWYFKCVNARSGGCDYFAWVDGPLSSFLREVLNDLRDEVWKLRREKGDFPAAVEEGRFAQSELAVGEKEAIVGVLKDTNNSHGGSMRIDPGVLAFLDGAGPADVFFFSGS